ncbi:class I SAM-dependent methyltransferase [Motilimonas sp. 1_MG-2023]|uniref:class I SAM-dependent methyltransferase n=1 Tax=Motilimonas TaxID=1914248 RepID=UPI0026E48D6F|nr:class I SAM-dependent methyltransferase [Motilimonas sp. 1_MG-2023]MDO6524960.1 class I SAM-dependent methyltransferase [Motilimonas sp. 1_MG-2023]
MNTYFQAYGERAFSLNNHTQIAGRYAIQRDAEKNIVKDVIDKVDLKSTDKLLEIGCGTGNLLIPMSFLVSHCVGIDHPNCLNKFTQRTSVDNITLFGGDFFTLPNTDLGMFDKIIIYSVLHCLPNEQSVIDFVDKALAILAPGGLMLIGDIPNQDTKQRFLNSKEGQAFSVDWAKKMADSTVSEVPFETGIKSTEFNDEKLFSLVRRIRNQGAQAYIMPQPSNLPFGYTREDVVIRKFA